MTTLSVTYQFRSSIRIISSMSLSTLCCSACFDVLSRGLHERFIFEVTSCRSARRILQIATNIILHTTFHTSRNKGSTTEKLDCETINARSQRPTIRSTNKNVNEVNLDNNLHSTTNLFSRRVLYSSNLSNVNENSILPSIWSSCWCETWS